MARSPSRRSTAPRPPRVPDDPVLHEALTRVVRDLGGQLDLHAAVETIFRAIRRIVPVDAFLLAVRRDGQYQVLFQSDLDDHGSPVFFPVPRPLRMTGVQIADRLRRVTHLLELRTAAEVRRLQERGNAPPGPGDPWHLTGNVRRRSASLLFVPLRFEREFAGMISVQSYRFRAYRPEHVRRMQAIAPYAALAVRQISRLHVHAANARDVLRRIAELLGGLRKSVDEGGPAVRERVAAAKRALDELRETLPATSA